MTEIVNLRLARKRKRRADKESTADENRIQHGRSAAEKAQASDQRALLSNRLEAHRRDPARNADADDEPP